MVSVCLQPGTGNRRKCPMAAIRAVRRRTERKGHARLVDAQVQRFRFRNDDQLRRGPVGGGGTQWIRTRQSGSAGLLQKDEKQWWRPVEPSRSGQRIFINVQPLTCKLLLTAERFFQKPSVCRSVRLETGCSQNMP